MTSYHHHYGASRNYTDDDDVWRGAELRAAGKDVVSLAGLADPISTPRHITGRASAPSRPATRALSRLRSARRRCSMLIASPAQARTTCATSRPRGS